LLIYSDKKQIRRKNYNEFFYKGIGNCEFIPNFFNHFRWFCVFENCEEKIGILKINID